MRGGGGTAGAFGWTIGHRDTTATDCDWLASLASSSVSDCETVPATTTTTIQRH